MDETSTQPEFEPVLARSEGFETVEEEEPKAPLPKPVTVAEVAGVVVEEPSIHEVEMPPVSIGIPEPELPTPVRSDQTPQMVTVVLRSMGDRARDILRMRRIHGTLISYPGNDRFAFYVIERSRGYRLEFPNDSTNASSEMLDRLQGVVGKENVIVEPITYQ